MKKQKTITALDLEAKFTEAEQRAIAATEAQNMQRDILLEALAEVSEVRKRLADALRALRAANELISKFDAGNINMAQLRQGADTLHRTVASIIDAYPIVKEVLEAKSEVNAPRPLAQSQSSPTKSTPASPTTPTAPPTANMKSVLTAAETTKLNGDRPNA